MSINQARAEFHQNLCRDIIRLSGAPEHPYPNFADGSNRASVGIASLLCREIGCAPPAGSLTGQTAGDLFEKHTRTFVDAAFSQLSHLRPGRWLYTTQMPIAAFAQYQHLAHLSELIAQSAELRATFGSDYLVKPDVIVARKRVTDEEINRDAIVLEDSGLAQHTPFRAANETIVGGYILHASLSCKWTIRSDRSQNARTEALNLIRNRKGHTPHIVAVTAEPLPMRIASHPLRWALATSIVSITSRCLSYSVLSSRLAMKISWLCCTISLQDNGFAILATCHSTWPHKQPPPGTVTGRWRLSGQQRRARRWLAGVARCAECRRCDSSPPQLGYQFGRWFQT